MHWAFSIHSSNARQFSVQMLYSVSGCLCASVSVLMTRLCQSHQVAPSNANFAAALMACGEGGAWASAMALLDDMALLDWHLAVVISS